MIDIISSVLEQFILVMTILTAKNLFFKQKIDSRKIKYLIMIFIMVWIILCLLKKPFPITLFNVLFIFIIHIVLEKDISLQIIKEFIFSYFIVAFGNVLLTVLFTFFKIDVFNHLIITSLVYLVFIIMNLIVNRFYHFYSSNILLIIIAIVSVTFSFYLIFINNIYSQNEEDIVLNSFMFTILFLSLIFVLLLLYVREQYMRLLEEKKKQDFLEMIKIKEQYVDYILNYNENLRKFKHDYKSQLLTIETYVLNHDDQALLQYIHHLQNDLYSIKQISSHQGINSILSYFIDKYSDIQIQVDDCVIGTIKIPQEEISSLFYNLICNACEASSQLENGKIIVSIKNINEALQIIIENSISHEFHIDTITNKVTTKKDVCNHGIGLIIINEIVDRYNGMIQYSVKNNVLINEIILFDVIQ